MDGLSTGKAKESAGLGSVLPSLPTAVEMERSDMSVRVRYTEIILIGLLCLTFGIVNIDMLGINFLFPFIRQDMGLSNVQTGMIVSGYWVAFSLSSSSVGYLSRKLGGQKTTLIVFLLLCSLCSILPALTSTFATLMAARLLMGLLEGPILPTAQSIVAMASPAERRGLNMGIVQSLGSNIMTGFLAPLVLVSLADRFGWRAGFLLVALPGMICAMLVAMALKLPDKHIEASTYESPAVRLADIMNRNVLLCAIGSSFSFASVTIGFGFLPLFFTGIRGFSTDQMSSLMSVVGISGLIFGILLPAISDRVGRKSVMIAASLIGLAGTAALISFNGSIALVGLLTFLSFTPAGATLLFSSTVPSESVPAHAMSAAIGFSLSVSTLLGGVAGPLIAGWAADSWSLRAPLFLQLGCCVATAIVAMALKQGGATEEQRPAPIAHVTL